MPVKDCIDEFELTSILSRGMRMGGWADRRMPCDGANGVPREGFVRGSYGRGARGVV